MSDSYNYNFLKILTEQSIDLVDSKSLLTFGMIGITCIVLGAATIYDEIGGEATEETPDESVFAQNLSPSGEKSFMDTVSETIGDKGETTGDKGETTGGKKTKKNRRTKRNVSKT